MENSPNVFPKGADALEQVGSTAGEVVVLTEVSVRIIPPALNNSLLATGEEVLFLCPISNCLLGVGEAKVLPQERGCVLVDERRDDSSRGVGNDSIHQDEGRHALTSTSRSTCLIQM